VAESRDETRQLLKTLKHLFKAAGLRYADIAARLGVSEGTIKRYLNQQGLTVQVLQLLCECADVTLAELAKLAAEENTPVQPAATPDQERQLAGDIILSMTFFLLARGWRPEQIAREFSLQAAELTHYLVRLDRIGMIALFPRNRVRVLRAFARNLSPQSATYALVARRVHEFFDHVDLADPAVAWTSGFARLSETSLSQISQRLHRLRDEIFELGEQDFNLPPERVKWCALFAALRPVSMEKLLHENYQEG
jgi:transcriptional regulator with XRE-family HTH domain